VGVGVQCADERQPVGDEFFRESYFGGVKCREGCCSIDAIEKSLLEGADE
jgi:hypothetical protein